jgi:tetratricopeptide (TPR) repeat protein
VKNKAYGSKQLMVFRLITLFIPVLLLLFFEGALRILNYGDDLSLFVQNPRQGYEDYLIVNPKVGKKYFQKFEYTSPPNDTFKKQKSEGTKRIFVLGSSTVYGFPYERNLMFSRILHARLEETYPDMPIEVINTAITAINSFTLLDYMPQVLAQNPDAILIYAGHNEFYGAFGAGSNETMSRNRKLSQLHIKLLNVKVYQLMRNTFAGLAKKIALRNKQNLQGTLMKRMIASDKITYGSETYRSAMSSFKYNMSDLLQMANKKNTPVFLSQVVSNVKDISPFNSVSQDTLPAAIDVYENAMQAMNAGDSLTAQPLFNYAKDLDCIRFRASEELNSLIAEMAQKYNCSLVQMEEVFKEHAKGKLIGDNLMTEHVHPNISGSFLMAETFYNALIQSEIFPKNNIQSTEWAYFKRNWGYTALDSLVALHRVGLLKSYWPFVPNPKDQKDYRKTYHPHNWLDSLAFSIVKYSDITFEDIRLELARKYEKQGSYQKAFYEFEALRCINPYLADNYRDAARLLIKLNDIPRAIQYYKKSLEFDENYFTYFKIGELLLLKGDYNRAVKYFEKAYPLAPDKQRLSILSKAYLAFSYSGQTEKARTVANDLKKFNNNKPLVIPPKKYLFNQYIPFETKNEVLKANELIEAKNYTDAIQLLEHSLEKYRSHIAVRILGETYANVNAYEKAIYHLSSVYSQFEFDPGYLQTIATLYLKTNQVNKEKECRQALEKLQQQ